MKFVEELPELNQSTVITINLQESDFMDKELYDFADFEDEDEDGTDDTRSHLTKKLGGFVWWNSEKSFSDNLGLNLRKNPYFKALILTVLIISVLVIFGVMIAVSLSKKQVPDSQGDKPQDSLTEKIVRILGTRLRPSTCLLYTSPSPRDQRGSRMPSSA